ncbi:hypothetical protein HPB48_000362 [Haemaphysalis longicornis]|uniref:Uncharacterized protein n=1 Tax=Haemaphysalis longicornis TaxID=44386 RepID=A0A9J6FIG0_HAELO|nr:hypothetical protein HPB48_000362 [Haemaphysalis longicornis]
MFALLQSVNSRTEKMEQDQVKLISSVNEIKNNQEAIERKVNDIDRRLAAVEAKACDNAEVGDELLQLRQLTDHLSRENARLHDEHSQLEDRMRRSNLLFYGLTDCPQEKWNQTEEKLVKEITTVFKSPVPSEALERVHRLGTYRPNQNRPVIAKFASFKLKQELLSLSGKFKENGITVSEDYSLQTRQARKKLVEFAKQRDVSFKLRYNKLLIGDKRYGYNFPDDSVYELGGASGEFVNQQLSDEHSVSRAPLSVANSPQ